jgi:hypothetical protein
MGGIKAMYFTAGAGEEIEFTQQMQHAMKLGSNAPIHLHVKLEEDQANDSETPIFCLEYLIWNVHEAIGNTITIDSLPIVNIGTGSKEYHRIIPFPAITQTNAGNPINISAMCIARMHRKEVDTYPHGVFLLQADFHIEVDSRGSREMWVK